MIKTKNIYDEKIFDIFLCYGLQCSFSSVRLLFHDEDVFSTFIAILLVECLLCSFTSVRLLLMHF